MMKFTGKSVITKFIQLAVFVAIGVFSRLLPHPANFTPIAAMALFGGTYLNKKQAFILPILAMAVSDAFIGFDSLPMRLSVYGSFLITVMIGFWVKKNKSFKNVVFASLLSSVIFFVVTNFTVWAFGTMYSKNLVGIAEAYIMAIPFFRNTVLGDLFYSGVFFGSFELVNIFRRGVSLQKA